MFIYPYHHRVFITVSTQVFLLELAVIHSLLYIFTIIFINAVILYLQLHDWKCLSKQWLTVTHKETNFTESIIKGTVAFSFLLKVKHTTGFILWKEFMCIQLYTKASLQGMQKSPPSNTLKRQLCGNNTINHTGKYSNACITKYIAPYGTPFSRHNRLSTVYPQVH